MGISDPTTPNPPPTTEADAEVTLGASATELNRRLFSELQRVEKKKRLQAEWASGDTGERFSTSAPPPLSSAASNNPDEQS